MLKISNGVVMSRVYLTGNNDTGNDILSLDVAVTDSNIPPKGYQHKSN